MAGGTDGDDYIVNTDLENHGYGGNDLIISHATSGNVLFYGEAGNDYIQLNFSGTASGYLFGGSGTDWLTGSVGSDHLYGDEGNDLLEGGGSAYPTGDDVLTGGGGTNGLYGYDGNDVLYGGVNDDGPSAAYPDGRVTISYYINQSTIFQAGLYGGAGNDTLNGGGGADLMVGGTGDDLYYVDNSYDQVIENANEGYDTIITSITAAYYWIPAMAAVERVEAAAGTAPIGIIGNAFANVMVGNDGDNYLDSNDGADRLIGGGGSDYMIGGSGVDTLEGGSGNDSYVLDYNIAETDILVETDNGGTDTVFAFYSYTLLKNFENLVKYGKDDGSLTGNAADNYLIGGDGNDTLDGRAGDDDMNGWLGNDTYIVDNADDRVSESSLPTVGGGTDTVKASVSFVLNDNIETLILTGMSDNNGTGNELANTITGNSGDNTLSGNVGNDTLDGKAGDDILIGGLGNDTYIVESLKDIVREASDEGTDTVRASVRFTLGASIERLILTGSGNVDGTGTALANTLTGNDGANRLSAGAGNDMLVGGGGADRLDGGSGSDTVSFAGSAKGVTASLASRSQNTNDARGDSYISIENLLGSSLADRLFGSDAANKIEGGYGNDTLDGGAGNDRIDGDAGNDRILGSSGRDDLTGGLGADSFIFSSISQLSRSKTSTDTIADFLASQRDEIDLSAIDANMKISGNQAFRFIGTNGFHDRAGELRYDKTSSDTYLQGDLNGDSKADFVLHLDDAIRLTTTDFAL